MPQRGRVLGRNSIFSSSSQQNFLEIHLHTLSPLAHFHSLFDPHPSGFLPHQPTEGPLDKLTAVSMLPNIIADGHSLSPPHLASQHFCSWLTAHERDIILSGICGALQFSSWLSGCSSLPHVCGCFRPPCPGTPSSLLCPHFHK